MQFRFNPETSFNASTRDVLRAMAARAFAACKVQFSSQDDHASPVCEFHVGGFKGNTGNLVGIHVTFSTAQALSEALSDSPAKVEQLIHHEMVHFFQSHLHGVEPYTYLPLWFSEGMAVAFSGQGIIARNSHLDSDYPRLGGSVGWERYYLMKQYRNIDCTRPPFDVLYDSWGALFIYAVTEKPSMFPDHAFIAEDTYLHARVGQAECAKALAIMDSARHSGFDVALKQHTGRERILECGFRQFLAAD
ncbi:hypothetical protein N5D36_00890 [Pseudomonas mosselii]|uniref:hypothetical protein n=1 Tax=Pseudomonas TaxID=286 RepID=UPI001F4659EE|nr:MULTISPECIES: hypothetical protein [Pseudomonas]MCF1488298.1 hypothetical protein [Pseudomonas sp. AA27]MDH0626521.1 hypothetical protein [Pseudomonas mosselii]MDH0676005.1 hypothetical protein [Pseudomonas mosselii]MDH0925095.1 hypothetical protein [Pseudomonas mosselii]MDH1133264.1 hypothetical protein [Pseudomonas mosselii]